MYEDGTNVVGPGGRWVKASTYGWLLGLLVVAGLGIIGDLTGLTGGVDVQFIVGVGIGGGVGYLQSRVLRDRLSRPVWWTVASAVGMGGLFIVHDATVAFGGAFPFSLPIYVLVGSLVAGAWQSALLRRVSARAIWWIPGSVLGWGVPAALIALADFGFAGRLGDLASLVAIFLGGAILGAVSGGFLRSALSGAGQGDPAE